MTGFFYRKLTNIDLTKHEINTELSEISGFINLPFKLDTETLAEYFVKSSSFPLTVYRLDVDDIVSERFPFAAYHYLSMFGLRERALLVCAIDKHVHEQNVHIKV